MDKHIILIVDDEPELLESLSLLIEEHANVRTALDGLRALDIIGTLNKSLSLIILDLDMPKMNGVELLRRVRASNNPVPVMILTGRSTHETAIACAGLTVQGYLDKVIDARELIGKIKKVLGIKEFGLLRELWREEYETKIDSLTPTMKRVVEYLQDNYHNEISGEDIAARFLVTPSHLSRQFYKECGIYLHDYINMLKVSNCKKYLMDIEKKGSDIARMVGISDVNYLYRLFKKYTGLTTQEFRKSHIK